MLKLKRVDLQGFKSFCDRSEMRFPGTGIAAIVGPNGCGKSNLSDAISWVLGEQSAKSLRGTRMEDVIFAGTRDRKPLSMAQVNLTLVDPDCSMLARLHPALAAATESNSTGTAHNGAGSAHTAPASGPREITISRRLYRDGASEYLIDGKSARLRDIQDIFLGTGLGPESYAIIEQGRIGQLLSSKPHDRRAVIEEAAGISKFKTRRRLAEAKLENAKQNLSRVFDILEEVGRQAASLKRQAQKAKRYHELHSEMVWQLRLALIGKYRLLEREATKVALELNEAQAQFQSLSGLMAAQEIEQQALRRQSDLIEGELTATREMLAQLRLEAERTRGRIESQAREIANIESRLTQSETEGQALEVRQMQLGEEVATHTLRLQELEQHAGQARQRLEEKSREREQLQAQLQQREATIESGRQQVLQLLGEVSTLNNQRTQLEGLVQSLERDRARLTREEQMATAELASLDQRKQEISENLARRQLELESLGDQRRCLEEDLGGKKSAASRTRTELEELRQEVSRLKARKDSLEGILSHRAYTTDSVKRLFTALDHGQARDLKPAGVLADFVEVDAQYEKATEEFLHDELEYVIVTGWGQADLGIDLMRTDMDGRATFLVHPEAGDPMASAPGTEPVLGPETGIAARLSDVLRLTNGLTQAPASLLPRLARCFLAESRSAAQRLARHYPDFYFLTTDGVCYHGHAVSGGRKTGSGPLALKRELRELASTFASRQRLQDEITTQLAGLDADIGELTGQVEKIRTRQEGEEREALALDHEVRRLAEEFSRANSRLSVSRLELQRLEREAQQVVEQRDASLIQTAEKEQARLVQEEALAAARSTLAELQESVRHVSEEHSVLRVELASWDERQRAEKNAQTRLETQLSELTQRREELTGLIGSLGADRGRLLGDNVALDEVAGRLGGEIAGAEAEVERLAVQESALREQEAAAEETLRGLRAEVQVAQERRSQIELVMVERRAELKYLDETAHKELKASLQELAQQGPAEADEITLAEAEEKYQSLKTKIENLGPVNADALQEYEEAQQRYDFLNAQRQDLLDSIRDTEKAIQDIDVESRRRFADAFQAINENFKETFARLFGGGVAEMHLTDPANVNDSGVDIIASPPGKRLQNVLLLSGGEKALTALALLMAIFRYTPSPFCILDEVDAPLDEPNIQRLMTLLRQMAEDTQFIIITHARRTMESASALYGVTMQEPGVSKLVSVRFEGDPPPVARSAAAFAAHA